MAKVLMIQGTMSSAGKSFLTAAFCRIFRQDGYRTAPFKSQNMALNSYITDEGLEMGRAQVMQAEAAKARPEVAMNPILLKPTSDMGSQLIVNGEVCGNYSAAEYFKMKKGLVPVILDAYRSLEKKYDVIVVEGAGSPAEINLKEGDIVNMGLARLIDAPVLLCGDIDRGGVFAQLYGTAALLEESERSRIKAFLINKFRGDKALLEPGLSMLYERCKIPVAGVIPYGKIDLDDEDSLAVRLNGTGTERPEAVASVGVVRLPHLSNFTDFNALERICGLSLSYLTRPEEVSGCDLVVLPGTKNTMGDLKWMRENGLEAAVKKRAAAGALIFGICGGYQMLGESLEDPYGVEEGGALLGMGLLPVRTVFTREKTRTRMTGTANFGSGASVIGYEIHMGETKRNGGRPFSTIHAELEGSRSGERDDGCVLKNCYGTYLHGVFDREEMQREVCRLISTAKGLAPEAVWAAGAVPRATAGEYKDGQYEKLAALVRDSVDMDMIYRILNREI